MESMGEVLRSMNNSALRQRSVIWSRDCLIIPWSSSFRLIIRSWMSHGCGCI